MIRKLRKALAERERELMRARTRQGALRLESERMRSHFETELRSRVAEIEAGSQADSLRLKGAALAAEAETARIRGSYDALRTEYGARLRALKAENLARTNRVLRDYRSVFAKCQALQEANAKLSDGRGSIKTRPTSSIVGTRTRRVPFPTRTLAKTVADTVASGFVRLSGDLGP